MPARLRATDEDFIPFLTVDRVSPGMRVLALIVVAGLARTAHADEEIVLPHRATGLLLEMRFLDAGPAGAGGVGPAARVVFGHCRFGLLTEAGLGVLGDRQSWGAYGSARIGTRLLLERFQDRGDQSFVADLALDAGVGGNVYWLDHLTTEPEAFFGWAALFHNRHRGMELDMRIAIAPGRDDMATELCRGTCVASGKPFDVTFSVLAGVMRW